MFEVDLQLFGGGGSKSGLGGEKGGGKTSNKSSGGPKGYIFYFYKGDKKVVRWIEGSTPNQARKNAEKIAKQNGYVESEPMGKHMTFDDAKKQRPTIRKG